MRYLYYSLNHFYKEVLKIENWGDNPFFYCIVVISVLESMALSSILDFYLALSTSGNFLDYSKWIPIFSIVLLFGINYYYFSKLGNKILTEINCESKKKRFYIRLVSFLVIVFVLSLFFYTGNLIRTNNQMYPL